MNMTTFFKTKFVAVHSIIQGPLFLGHTEWWHTTKSLHNWCNGGLSRYKNEKIAWYGLLSTGNLLLVRVVIYEKNCLLGYRTEIAEHNSWEFSYGELFSCVRHHAWSLALKHIRWWYYMTHKNASFRSSTLNDQPKITLRTCVKHYLKRIWNQCRWATSTVNDLKTTLKPGVPVPINDSIN